MHISPIAYAVRITAIIALAGCTRDDKAASRSSLADAGSEVRAALDSSVDAWNHGDLEGHVAVYADSAVFRPGGGERGRVQARRTFAPFFANPRARPRLALDNLAVSAMSAEYVLATGQYVLTGDTVTVSRRGWFTEVWVRTPQGWRIILDHLS